MKTKFSTSVQEDLDRKKAINLILDGHINSYIGHEAFLKEFLPEEYR